MCCSPCCEFLLPLLCQFSGHRCIEIKHRFFTRQQQHLSLLSTQQFLLFPDSKGLDRDRFVALQQPALKPVADRGQILRLNSMSPGHLNQIDSFRISQDAPGAFGLSERLPRSVDVEEILSCRADQSGFGGSQQQIIRMIQTEGHLAENILFGILWPDGFNQPPECADIAGRCCTGDAFIQCHDVTGHGAASGTAGETNSLRINFRSTADIIHGSHGIMQPICGRVATNEYRADAHQKMFSCGAFVFRAVLVIQNLRAFALPNGVEAQCGHAQPDHLQCKSLIVIGSLGGTAVSAGDNHGRYRSGSCGQIQVGSDAVPRLTVKDDAFNFVTISLDGTDSAGVQRCACGQWSQLFQKELAA